MGGSAAVLGAAAAIAALQPQGVEVHFIAPACENMVAGAAMLPSDVLTASNGKTVEVRPPAFFVMPKIRCQSSGPFDAPAS